MKNIINIIAKIKTQFEQSKLQDKFQKFLSEFSLEDNRIKNSHLNAEMVLDSLKKIEDSLDDEESKYLNRLDDNQTIAHIKSIISNHLNNNKNLSPASLKKYFEQLTILDQKLSFLSENLSKLIGLIESSTQEQDYLQIHIKNSNYRKDLTSFIDTLKNWKYSLDSIARISGENVSHESLLAIEPGSILMTVGGVSAIFAAIIAVVNKASSAAKQIGEARKAFAEVDKIHAETEKIKAETIKTLAESEKIKSESKKTVAETKKIEHELDKADTEKQTKTNSVDKFILEVESGLQTALVEKIVIESLIESGLSEHDKNDLNPKLTKSIQFLLKYFVDGNEVKLITGSQKNTKQETLIFNLIESASSDKIKLLMSALEKKENKDVDE